MGVNKRRESSRIMFPERREVMVAAVSVGEVVVVVVLDRQTDRQTRFWISCLV